MKYKRAKCKSCGMMRNVLVKEYKNCISCGSRYWIKAVNQKTCGRSACRKKRQRFVAKLWKENNPGMF